MTAIEYFAQTLVCAKCGRPRREATLCSTGGGVRTLHENCPTAEHLHWLCPCGYSWLSWPRDVPHGPTRKETP